VKANVSMAGHADPPGFSSALIQHVRALKYKRARKQVRLFPVFVYLFIFFAVLMALPSIQFYCKVKTFRVFLKSKAHEIK